MKQKPQKPRIVMPLSSVIMAAILSFGIGLYVGRGFAPKPTAPSPHSMTMSQDDPHASAQADIDVDKVMADIQTTTDREKLVAIGNEMYDMHQPPLAIAAYEKALKIDPNDANVRTDLANMYKEAGRVDEAIAQLRDAIRVDPEHENSRYNIGIILLHDKSDMKGAIRAWEEYLQVFPNGEHAELVKRHLANMKR